MTTEQQTLEPSADEAASDTVEAAEAQPNGQALATIEQPATGLSPTGPMHPDEWRMLAQVANTIAHTDFVPKGLRGNKPAVMACLLYGRDQGLPPMVSLSEIAIVDGRPTMSAALMVAKIRSAGHKVWREEHRDPDGKLLATTAHGRRRDGTEDSFTYSLEMAGRANLLGKPNWKQYPEAMLWARAVSQLARLLFSDVFLGTSVYTGDELGAETAERDRATVVDPETGEIVAAEEAAADDVPF